MVGPKMDEGSGTVNLVPLAEARPPALTASEAGGGAGPGAFTEALKSSRGGGAGKKAKKGVLPAASSVTTDAQGTPMFTRQDMVVGASGEGSAVRMRMATSQALGQLIKRVHNQVRSPLLCIRPDVR